MSARDLLAAATPRPWRVGQMDDTQDCVYVDHPPALVARVPGITSPREAIATAALIAAAVNEYETLLDIVDALDAPAVTAALHQAAADATLDPETFERDFAPLNAVFNLRTRLDAVRSRA